jgi:basic membrane protein A
MKSTIKKLLGLVLAGVMVLTMASCGKENEEPATSSDSGNTAQTTTIKKIAMLLPGEITDQGWNTTAYNALEEFKKRGYETTYIESVENASIEQTFRTYADQGYDLIIGHGAEFGNGAAIVGEEYPDKYFFVTGKKPEGITAPDNVAFLDIKEYEGAYLCGIAAGMTTKSKVVGYLGGIEQASQLADRNGFIEGVHSVDPSIKVIDVMAGTFGDSSLGKESATAMIEQGADVLMHTCDTTGLGLIEAAKENNVYICGYGSDQSSLAPDLMLTSFIPETQKAILTIDESIKNNTFGGVMKVGVKEGIVTLGKFGPGMSEEAKTKVNEAMEKMKNGEELVQEDLSK